MGVTGEFNTGGNLNMKKKKSTSYNTGGKFQPVGYPVDPALIRQQKKQLEKERGNFWTGLGEFATNYLAPIAIPALAGASGAASAATKIAQKEAAFNPANYQAEFANNYAQDTTPVIPNKQLNLNNQQPQYG